MTALLDPDNDPTEVGEKTVAERYIDNLKYLGASGEVIEAAERAAAVQQTAKDLGEDVNKGPQGSKWLRRFRRNR